MQPEQGIQPNLTEQPVYNKTQPQTTQQPQKWVTGTSKVAVVLW